MRRIAGRVYSTLNTASAATVPSGTATSVAAAASSAVFAHSRPTRGSTCQNVTTSTARPASPSETSNVPRFSTFLQFRAGQKPQSRGCEGRDLGIHSIPGRLFPAITPSFCCHVVSAMVV